MSIKSSFREQLERPGKPQVVDRDPSGFPVRVRIEPVEGFRSSVTLAQYLRDHGLGLAGGHAAVTELAANGKVEVTALVTDPDDFVSRLTELGLTVRIMQDAANR